MLSTLDHGFTGLLFAYALALLGVFVGVRIRRVPLSGSIARVPLVALVAFAGSLIFWVVISELNLLHIGQLAPGPRELLGAGLVILVGMFSGLRAALIAPALVVHRGTRLLERSGDAIKRSAGESVFTFAGESVAPTDETKHFKVIGTTGTGKSTAIRELLRGALARNDRAVIADPDGGYARAFYDPVRGDVILNPFDSRAHRWDLMAEIVHLHDADQLARSIIPDYEGTDRSWRHYARTFLTAVLRQLHRLDIRDLEQLYHVLVLAPPSELRELIGTTPAGSFLGESGGGHEGNRFFESVRSVTNVHAAALEHIARQKTGELLSVRRWVREGRGVLFLPYRASELDALRDVVSTWMRLAVFETMNGEESDRRVWFVVDELDALGAIDGLKDALARLRKFGGRCVLGFQSIAQVRGTYGDTEAQTIVENCGNTLILRCSASERGGTAEFASRLIGQREIVRPQMSESRPAHGGARAHATRTLSHQYVIESAVLASEIEQLPDLRGFLKLASQPEWRRVSLAPA